MRLDKNQPNPRRSGNDIFITLLSNALFFYQYYMFMFYYILQFLYNERVNNESCIINLYLFRDYLDLYVFLLFSISYLA